MQHVAASAGAPLAEARVAMLMVHGRGATAADIISLSAELNVPGVAYLAPQAPGFQWYPNRFLNPIADNEPWLSRSLAILDEMVTAISGQGIPVDQIVLLGFSQGACLALEYAARNARRYGAVVGLSGGLIGPEGMERDYPGSLAGTPVFLGCSDVDPHIPVGRVHHTAQVLERMGAEVLTRIYPGMGHAVSIDEIGRVESLVGRLSGPG